MPFTIIRQDITLMHVDAVVNAANTKLRKGGGVCGAIFSAAGAKQLQEACDKLSPIKTGEAVITPGFNLRAKFIIHAAGPKYKSCEVIKSRQLLYSAYIQSLKLAEQNKCESIAFPLISSGIYGYPKDEALQIAVSAIKNFLNDHDMDIYLVIFDRESFEISRILMGHIDSYIDHHYVYAHSFSRTRKASLIPKHKSLPESMVFENLYNNKNRAVHEEKAKSEKNIDDLMRKLDEPFNAVLLKLIDAKGKTDTQVYKKANISRKLFSKIRTGNGYNPSKRTILALAIALELDLKETDELLETAGYALSHSQKFDVIIEYFIISKQYDIFEINQVLFKYDQPLLGGA